MKKGIILENQKGFYYKNGKYEKMLGAGSYFVYGGREIEVFNINECLEPRNCSLPTLLADPAVAQAVSVVEVSDTQLCLHFVDGKYAGYLRAGKHAFFNEWGEHSYILADISTPDIGADIPAYVFQSLPLCCYTKVEVAEYQKARLCYDGVPVRVLECGTYYFWKGSVKVSVEFIDMRLTEMDISGQEMLTADKVSVRVNFVCSYRVKDCTKILTEVDDYASHLRVRAQLALREYISKTKLDELLWQREGISAFVLEALKAREDELYVEFLDAGVKDIILPGEIRDIMNTVLIAEKRAQANVITRREEVASTRSLLNTARLMEENKTLYRLKELEYIERICENVSNINLSAGGDILAALSKALTPSDS